jgi:hypothetical protein
MGKLEYKVPTIQYWPAKMLDGIEATMSGGGGYVPPAPYRIAYVYGFNFGDGVNTTSIASQEQMYLSNMGYTTYLNTDKPASFAINTSPITGLSRMNSGVFVFNGHAGGGSCQFRASPNQTYLTAEMHSGAYYKFENISMSHCRAAFFMGCSTATYRQGYGNLLDTAIANGAKCAFGWKYSVNTQTATSFRERLFYFLRYGYTVSDAAANAASEMPWFDSTREYTIKGDSAFVLSLTSVSALGSTNPSNGENVYSIVSEIITSNQEDYLLLTHSDKSIKLYIECIRGIPTTRYIAVDAENYRARIIGEKFDAKARAEAELLFKNYSLQKDRLLHQIGNNFTYDQIINAGPFTVFALVDGEVHCVSIVINEIVGKYDDSRLEILCADKLSGNVIDYTDLINSNYSRKAIKEES